MLVVTVIGYPILSRLYSDIQFGELAIFQSSVIILAQLSTLNYEEALVLINKEAKFKSILTSTLHLNLLFSLLSSIIIFLFWILHITPDSYVLYAFLLPLALVLRGSMRIGNYAFISQKLFKKVSVLKVLDRSSFQLLTTGFGFLKLPGNFLIIAYLIANFLSGIYSLFNIKRYLTGFENWNTKIKTLKEYSDFPKFALPSIFLDQLSRQLPVYFITYIISTEITGQFSMAYRVLSIPEMIIGASIGQLFYKKLTELHHNQKPIKRTIVKLWIGLFVLGLLPFGIMLLFGGSIFSFVFGENWKMAGEIASYLSPMLFAMFISTPSSFIFTVLRNQRRGLIINVIVLVVRTVVLYVGLTCFSFLTAIMVFALSEITLIIFYNMVAWRLLNQAKK